MFRRNLLNFIALILVFWSLAYASTSLAEEIRGVVLLSDEKLEDSSDPSQKVLENDSNEEQIVLEFDPKILDSNSSTKLTDENINEDRPIEKPVHKMEKLLYESNRMRHYKYQSKLKREIVIPNSIEDVTLLTNLEQLSIAEQNLFFTKKEAFLQKVVRLSRLLHMRNKNTNRLTHLFNKMLYTNAPLVVRSIRSKTMISLGVSLGVGFSDKILEKMKAILNLNKIPEVSGFYLMTSVGLTLHYVEKNEKKRFRFSSFNLENRWATEIYSPFVLAAGGVAVTYMRSTKTEDDPVEKGEIFHTSLANLNQSPSEYGVTTRLFTPLIPGGAIAVFKGSYANYKLTPAGFSELLKDSLRFLWPRKSKQCAQSLNDKL